MKLILQVKANLEGISAAAMGEKRLLLWGREETILKGWMFRVTASGRVECDLFLLQPCSSPPECPLLVEPQREQMAEPIRFAELSPALQSRV